MELLYVAHIQDSNEIFESLWSNFSFVLMIYIGMFVSVFFFNNTEEEKKKLKFLIPFILIFSIIFISYEYYKLTATSNNLKKAFTDDSYSKSVVGVVDKYYYIKPKKLERFYINDIIFYLETPNPLIQSQYNSISTKRLKLKVEYIDSPLRVVVRVWKL